MSLRHWFEYIQRARRNVQPMVRHSKQTFFLRRPGPNTLLASDPGEGDKHYLHTAGPLTTAIPIMRHTSTCHTTLISSCVGEHMVLSLSMPVDLVGPHTNTRAVGRGKSVTPHSPWARTLFSGPTIANGPGHPLPPRSPWGRSSSPARPH